MSRQLEVKEFYKIKTPLFGKYKRCLENVPGFENVLAFIENLYRANPEAFNWSPTGVSSFEECFAGMDATASWYKKNRSRLEEIRTKAMELQRYCAVSGDWFLYCNAVMFAMGTFQTVPKRLLMTDMNIAFEVLCYYMDFSRAEIHNLDKAFCDGKYGYSEFRSYLPVYLTAWTGHSSRYCSSAENAQFESYAILVFDIMLEIASFVDDTIGDCALAQIRREQIATYYKWLKTHKLYLPKELQNRLCEYVG